jgi:hypothetical protein
MGEAAARRVVVSLDGGGVVADEPLVFGEGARLRLHVTGTAAEDVTLYIEGGRVHLVGHRARLVLAVSGPQPNHISVLPVVPGADAG